MWQDIRLFSGLTSDCSSTTPFEETFTSCVLPGCCVNSSCSAIGGVYNSVVCGPIIAPVISSPQIVITTYGNAQCQGTPTSVQYIGATPFNCLGAASVSYWYECNTTTGVTRLRYSGTSGACFSASPIQVLALSTGPLGVCSGNKIATCVGFANGTATPTTKTSTTSTSSATTRPAQGSISQPFELFSIFGLIAILLL